MITCDRIDITPNNAFIGTQIKFDEVLKRLAELRDNGYGMGKGPRDWSQVGTAAKFVNQLVAAINELEAK